MIYLFGIIGIVIGFLITWKSEWFLEQLGTIEWAEQHLATSGGTRFFWKLLGIAISLLSLLLITGILQKIILGIFGPLFRGLAPS